MSRRREGKPRGRSRSSERLGGVAEGGSRSFHEPVLADETLTYLSPHGTGLYLDGTVGGGGHALRLLEHCAGCRLLAVDRDPDALAEAAGVLAPHSARVRFLEGTFHEAASDAEVRATGLSGALLDLGVSSHQLDIAERGFQFGRGAPLDMRMGPAESSLTAAELLNGASEAELARLFSDFGEEPRARKLAREIVRRRSSRPLVTSDDLVGALASALGRSPSNRDKARIFQALRIAVNQELDLLSRTLPELRDVLLPQGTMVVIAYHSLEDRVVKKAFREWSSDCVCPPELPICRCRGRALGETLTRKPVRPGEEESVRNPRSRSALLRAWRKAA
jgi:16S rRNA (cytosine1402-N4)-methyltransferase